MSSWQTTKPGPNPLKGSLVKRAKKREAMEISTPNSYVVFGNEKLGDTYDEYYVTLDPDEIGGGHCDCMSPDRPGSEYRKTCSHITTALLYQQEHGAWGEADEIAETTDDVDEIPVEEPNRSTESAVPAGSSPSTKEDGQPTPAPPKGPPPPEEPRGASPSCSDWTVGCPLTRAMGLVRGPRFPTPPSRCEGVVSRPTATQEIPGVPRRPVAGHP